MIKKKELLWCLMQGGGVACMPVMGAKKVCSFIHSTNTNKFPSMPLRCTCDLGGIGVVASHGRELVGLTFWRGHWAQCVPQQWDDIKRVA